MVGENPVESPDLVRIISDRHMSRLTEIIEKMPKEKLCLGGDYDTSLRYIGKFEKDRPWFFFNVLCRHARIMNTMSQKSDDDHDDCIY